MKLGIIGRLDNRGIGYQTLEATRALEPDRVLAVQLNDPKWPEDPDRFGRKGVTFVASSLTGRDLDQDRCRTFLEGLDVVFAVETVYDWRFIDWANEMGVEVVVQGNPEFLAHHHNPEWSCPKWVWPTWWMIEDIPPGPILPVPAPPTTARAAHQEVDRLKVLHVAGHAAAGDRNGTQQFVECLASIRGNVDVTIVGQDGWLPHPIRHPKNVDLHVEKHGVDDRFSMYDGQHVVVLPRRYGGNCLPAIEALAVGCVVVMPDCSPNEMWPGPRVRSRPGRVHRTPFGPIRTSSVHPVELARPISDLAANRDRLGVEQALASDWAAANTWEQMLPLYHDTLERPC